MIKKPRGNKYAEKVIPVHCWWECAFVAVTMGNNIPKLKNLYYDPAVLLLIV